MLQWILSVVLALPLSAAGNVRPLYAAGDMDAVIRTV